MNEKEIIKRCQNGDKAAFNELIRVFYPYVTKYLLKLSHDETLTEVLTQDVFLKVIRTIERFNPNGKASFATYVITIAKNTFIDYTRRSKNVFSDLSDIDLKSDDNIENSVITSMQYREVLKYIDSLPPNDFFPSGHMGFVCRKRYYPLEHKPPFRNSGGNTRLSDTFFKDVSFSPLPK